MPAPTFSYDYVVAVGGGSSGGTAGTIGDPFSLTYALSGAGGRITAGKVVAMRGNGGDYVGTGFDTSLNGAIGTGVDNTDSKIIFRSYPGETARINGRIRLSGTYVWLWGIECYQSDPQGADNANDYGFTDAGTRNRHINCISHDHGKSGFYSGGLSGPSSHETGYYGCIAYNNGDDLHSHNLDHGCYQHNAFSADTVRVYMQECVMLNNMGYGFHCYDDTDDMRKFDMTGCVSFNNGTVSGTANYSRANYLFAVNAGTATVDDVSWNSCFGYHKKGNSDNAAFFPCAEMGASGIAVLANTKMVINGCYFAGGNGCLQDLSSPKFTNATVTNNTFVQRNSGDRMIVTDGTISGYTWGTNTHYGGDAGDTLTRWRHAGTDRTWANWKTATGLGGTDTRVAGLRTTTDVFVRPNSRETGRGHVIIYNWHGDSSVSVDVSSILTVNDFYEVRSMSKLGTALFSGVYSGGSISFPMTGVTPTNPIAGAAGRLFTTPLTTAPEFDCFLVQATGTYVPGQGPALKGVKSFN